jgi:integrase
MKSLKMQSGQLLANHRMRPWEFFEMKKDQVSLSEGWIRPISYKTGRRRMATAQPEEMIVPLTDRARAEFEKLLAKSEDDYVQKSKFLLEPSFALDRLLQM